MKNWLKIGEFAELVGVSPRTLRLYEEAKLIESHARGENRYRYYTDDQIPQMLQILKFKKMGFELSEIKSLIASENAQTVEQLRASLGERLVDIRRAETDLSDQKSQIQNILTSLETGNNGLQAQERKYVMNTRGNAIFVVTGIGNIHQTALLIQEQLKVRSPLLSIFNWQKNFRAPVDTPYILTVHESELQHLGESEIIPDTVVIMNLSDFTPETEKLYLKLYSQPGPHMVTVFNADDRLSVCLADSAVIRKGRTFYFSKNEGLLPQIQKIGGAISDGDTIQLFGFNLKSGVIEKPLPRPLPLEQETSLLAALASVLDMGLSADGLALPHASI